MASENVSQNCLKYTTNLAINTAKYHKLPDDQKICRYCLRNDIENVLFDCDNYNALQQDTFKKIKVVDKH